MIRRVLPMIHRILNSFATREDGAVLLLVAVGAVALVGMLGLAVDLGMLYTARSEAQRAADAAALAGASAFQEGDPLLNPELVAVAEARAYETATLNWIRNAAIREEEVTIEPIPAESKVRVTIRRQNIGLWFAPVLRITNSAVAARAAAEAAPASRVSPAKCVKPFALPDMWRKGSGSGQDANRNQVWDFEPERIPGCNGNSDNCFRKEAWTWEDGDQYGTASSGNPTGYGSESRTGMTDSRGRQYTRDEGRRIPIKISTVPSYWQVWAMSGRGTPNALQAIKSCVPTSLSIGEQVDGETEVDIETEPGNMAQPIYSAFMDLITNGEADRVGENGEIIPGRPGDPDAYWDDAAGTVVNSRLADWRESSRVMTVALFHPEGMSQGRTDLRFVDFALLFLENPESPYGNPFKDDNPKHQRPITGRILKFAPGEAGGGTETGNLPRVLRLVE